MNINAERVKKTLLEMILTYSRTVIIRKPAIDNKYIINKKIRSAVAQTIQLTNIYMGLD